MTEFINEEKIKTALAAKFHGVITNAEVRRRNRVWAEAAPAALPEVLAWLKSEGFHYLSTVTGFDEGENLGAYYHLNNSALILNLKVKTPRANPVIPSILAVFPVAVSYEKELEDTLGIKVEGLPPGRRYPLAEDFPVGQYPLRKDWKVEDYLAAEAAKKTETK
ncbi:MAG TPA: NADH-quinone oxidoreductase subunit C [Elusimicrobiales bacterium]|nr:NADH-quinone oxidoreductase subunit C [Elusimicrobiales bacterium]